jgi:hypothetical protein
MVTGDAQAAPDARRMAPCTMKAMRTGKQPAKPHHAAALASLDS